MADAAQELFESVQRERDRLRQDRDLIRAELIAEQKKVDALKANNETKRQKAKRQRRFLRSLNPEGGNMAAFVAEKIKALEAERDQLRRERDEWISCVEVLTGERDMLLKRLDGGGGA